MDLVPTDIAAGLILLQVEQRKHSQAVRMVPITYLDQSSASTDIAGVSVQIRGSPERRAESTEQSTAEPNAVCVQPGEPAPRFSNANLSRVYPQPMEWMNIPAAAHYMRFAAASYGWPFFMYSNLFTGACQLSTQCKWVGECFIIITVR